jgi:hypothetical protein
MVCEDQKRRMGRDKGPGRNVFKVLSQYSSGGPEENKENLGENIRFWTRLKTSSSLHTESVGA